MEIEQVFIGLSLGSRLAFHAYTLIKENSRKITLNMHDQIRFWEWWMNASSCLRKLKVNA